VNIKNFLRKYPELEIDFKRFGKEFSGYYLFVYQDYKGSGKEEPEKKFSELFHFEEMPMYVEAKVEFTHD